MLASLPGVSGHFQRTLLGSLAVWQVRLASSARLRLQVAGEDTGWQRYGGDEVQPTSLAHVSDAYLTDLTSPASWYPAARKMQRTIIAHMGPTNSGKTYHALQALKEAQSGVYCGPLRLLAWEVAEKMNSDGVPFSLITGQERKLVEGSQHLACTVEMASVTREVEVGVVDEVQMVGDPGRGASFTRAVLGLPAATLHVCGDPAVLPLLRLLVQDAGDILEVRQYERLAPLAPANRALRSMESAARGDCLVAFSRREVHRIKRVVESAGRHSCGVVYGALPPELRAQQALLFNTARTGYNVLAASDAVGMGLNLNIRRIVFTSLEKYDGTSQRRLAAAEIKQIAGRAGRFGSRYDAGVVTCLKQDDMPYLHMAMAQPTPDVEQACLFPRFEQLALFADQNPERSLASALRAFADRATMTQHYFFGDFEAIHALAVMLRHLRLTLRERYIFAISPTDPDDAPVASALLCFASAYSSRGAVPAQLLALPPKQAPFTELQLQQLEALHRIYDLYIWLAFRLEGAFPDRALVAQWRAQCANMIQAGLEGLGREPEDWEDMSSPAPQAAVQRTDRRIRAAQKTRHFPKHLLRRPGEPPRPPVPQTGGSGPSDPWGDDFDPQAPLVFPQKPENESRSERRIRKREAGIARNIERDFGKGIVAPFSEDEDKGQDRLDILVPRYGPAPQPKKKKRGAKRKSSKPMPHYVN